MIPVPPKNAASANTSRHSQASLPVAAAMPPQTPPTQRSLRLRRNALNDSSSGNW